MRKLLLSLVLSLTAFSSYSQSTLLGDVNQDGKVSIADAMMVVNIIKNGYAPFSVSPTAVIIPAGGSATIDIEGGYNQYDVSSSNTDVVTASLSGSTITLTAVANGETTVTVKDVKTQRFMEVQVTVEDNQSQSYLTCPDDNHPHMIDLGLPSGTKWACSNVDTDHPENQSPTNSGGYYAWGETETKSVYNQVFYLYATGVDEDGNGWYDDYHSDTNYVGVWQNLGSDIAGTQYDVAHVKWGGSWVIPSREQQDELRNNCTYEWTTVNGVNGGKFTSKTNGGSIFLPAAGHRYDSVLFNVGSNGYYKSSTHNPSYVYYVSILNFYSGGPYPDTHYSFYGFTVRPVSRN
jgi:hypothetical protein